MLITFEGVDGSGKSTAARNLSIYLENQGYDVVLTREPGGTEIGQQLRSLLLGKDWIDIRAQLLLMMADRAQHIAKVIAPAIESGKVVICDRYIDSSLAYQGFGLGLNLNIIRQLNEFTIHSRFLPNLTFIFDVSYETARERLSFSRDKLDRYESMGRDFFDKIRSGYQQIIAGESQFRTIVAVDGELDFTHIEKIIRSNTELLLKRN